MTRFIFAFAACWLSVTSVLAGPKVTVVHSEKPSDYEKQAIALLSEQLKKLFEAEVTATATAPDGAEHLILLGRPETNATIKLAVGDRWPKLSQEGHVLRTLGDKTPTLLIGGGSDLATYWAVSELGHHFGIRYLLVGDVYPPVKPALSLTGFDKVLEPKISTRTWYPGIGSHYDTGWWSLKEQEAVQRQLQKLKFNGMRIPVELGGRGDSLPAETVPAVFRALKIASDAPGRRVFKSATEFKNPDVDTSRGIAAVGIFLMAVEDSGKTFGLSRQSDGKVNPAEIIALSDNVLGPLPQSHLRRMEGMINSTPDRSAFVATSRAAADFEAGLYYLSRRAWDPTMTADRAYHDLYTPIAGRDDSAGRLKLAFDFMEQANDQLTAVLKEHKLSFEPGPNMLVQLLTQKADLEPAFKPVLDTYIKSMNEFLRGHGNCDGSTRHLLFYYSKRGEYSLGLMNCCIALSAAAKARQAKQPEVELEQMEKAIEGLYMGLNALSEVARDDSDRGIIAVLNEWGFKPLNKELDRLTEAQ